MRRRRVADLHVLLIAVIWVCLCGTETGYGQGPGGNSWGTIDIFFGTVDGQQGKKYGANQTLRVVAGARGRNPCQTPMRVVLISTVNSPSPNSTVVAGKRRDIIVPPNSTFELPPEATDGFNVGVDPSSPYIGAATLHMEEIGPEPNIIPGDSKSIEFEKKK